MAASQREKIIVLVTDGQIACENEVLRLLGSSVKEHELPVSGNQFLKPQGRPVVDFNHFLRRYIVIASGIVAGRIFGYVTPGIHRGDTSLRTRNSRGKTIGEWKLQVV
ncbi:MAG: hypothetical protein KDB27_15245 [Planctomycetales bacterium]|nr:hypothetical protein [Planctomycetales bacterium]